MPTFAELFCRHYEVAPERYSRAVFWRCFHRRTLLLAPVIMLFNNRYFEPEYEVIVALSHLKDVQHLDEELDDYQTHPWSVGLVRRRLKVRLSTARLARLVRRVFRKEELRLASAGKSPAKVTVKLGGLRASAVAAPSDRHSEIN